MLHLLLLLIIPYSIALYSDLLDKIFNEYVDRYKKRDELRASCSNPTACVFDANGLYVDVPVVPSLLTKDSAIYPVYQPHFCGVSCPVNAYSSPMVHYSKDLNQLDFEDVCWSNFVPRTFLTLNPSPLYIAIHHHHNAAMFYPGFQTISYYDPAYYGYSRAITLGKSTFFIFYDTSSSSKRFKEKRAGIAVLSNLLSSIQSVRLVIFNQEAKIIQGYTQLGHTMLNRLFNELCQLTSYGGTKPNEPFNEMLNYIRNPKTYMEGNELHVIFISDLKVYRSKKTFQNTIKTFDNAVKNHFHSFHLHMFDSSEDDIGKRDWMKELACKYDGFYVRYKGGEEESVSIMKNFVEILKYRMNALTPGFSFPYTRLNEMDYGTFTYSAISIVKPYFMNVSDIDPLFPSRHVWTFSAIYTSGSIDESVVNGDKNYYPIPTIDKLRKYVLDSILGYHQCDSLTDFTEDEQKLIMKSINAYNYDWRTETPMIVCPYSRKLVEEDMPDQSIFCYKVGECPKVNAIENEDYDFNIQWRCSSTYTFIALFVIIITLFV